MLNETIVRTQHEVKQRLEKTNPVHVLVILSHWTNVILEQMRSTFSNAQKKTKYSTI
jgi:hypothetical protein